MYPFNFFLFVHFLYLVCLTVPSAASYNESCYRENRCDYEAALFCNDNYKCECVVPHLMVYDSHRAKCVCLAGKRCHVSSRFKIYGGECVSHAKFVAEICECTPGFYAHLNGTCEEQQLGKSCSSNEMCSQSHSVCGSEGTCGCDNTTSLYDSTRKTCVVKTGNNCSISRNEDDCVENAYCNTNYTCVCTSDYFKNAEGICERRRNYGELCKDNTYCKSNITVDRTNGWRRVTFSWDLVCNNGTCGCNSEVAVEYKNISNGIQICGKRLGKRCDRNDKCLEGAWCTRTHRSYSECQCDSDNYETEDKRCAPKKSYGQTCKLDKECKRRIGLLICDPLENICKCMNGTSREPDFPERCANSAEQSTNLSYSGERCVPNALCKQYDGYRFYCKCYGNTVASPKQNSYCFIRDGDSCFGDIRSPITNRTCLPGLICQNGTCSCLYGNHQEYNEKEEKCTSLINGPCNESSECTHNSECIDDDGFKVCRCKKGFIGVNKKCDLAYGESCVQGQSYPKCDRLVPLQCSVNGKCDCLPLQIYDNKALKCRGLAGAECELDKDNFCVEGAECKWFRSLGGELGICKCLPGMKYKEDGTCGDRTSTEIQKQT